LQFYGANCSRTGYLLNQVGNSTRSEARRSHAMSKSRSLIRDRSHRLFSFLAHTGSAIFVPEIQPVSRIDF
jgi:hypothetical protein